MRPTLFSLWQDADRMGGDLFKGMKDLLPAVFDADAVIDEIMTEYGECQPVTLQPAFLAMQITSWSARRAWAWQKYAQLYEAEFDPLENYHRTERGQDIRTPDLTHETEYGKTVDTTYGKSTETEYGGTNENTVSAYNVGTYQPSSKSEAGGSDTVTDSGTDTTEASGKDTVTETGKDTRDHYLETYGNIGVTTAQQMFKEQADLASSVDFIKMIGQEFAEKFIIPVW